MKRRRSGSIYISHYFDLDRKKDLCNFEANWRGQARLRLSKNLGVILFPRISGRAEFIWRGAGIYIWWGDFMPRFCFQDLVRHESLTKNLFAMLQIPKDVR